MIPNLKAHLLTPLLLLAAPLVIAPQAARAAEQLVPAGSLIQCTVAEPKINSKTESIGDPVLCGVSHVELYGRSVFPYGTYLEGRFEDYKDPGHFVGKGWMELKFDRLILGNTVVPFAGKVVYVPKYPVDKEGRIHGTGHPVRDAIEWAIPVLWPIDLLNLPRRGPRPTLKPETRLTLKVMDDFVIPDRNQVAQDSGLIPRVQNYAPQGNYAPQQNYAPQNYAPQNYAPPVQQSYAPPPPPAYAYAPSPQPVFYAAPPQPVFVSAPVLYGYLPPPPPSVLVPYGYAPYGPVANTAYRPRYYSPY